MNELQKVKVQMLEKFVVLHIALKMRLNTLLTELDMISIVNGKVVRQMPDGIQCDISQELLFCCENYQTILEQISNFGSFCMTDIKNYGENSKVYFEIGEQILYNLFVSENFIEKIDNNLMGTVDQAILDLQEQRTNVSVVRLSLKLRDCSYDEDAIKAALTEKGLKILNDASENEQTDAEDLPQAKNASENSKKITKSNKVNKARKIFTNRKGKKESWMAKNDKCQNNSSNIVDKQGTNESAINENINAVSRIENEIKYTILATENGINHISYTPLLRCLLSKIQVDKKGNITIAIPQLEIKNPGTSFTIVNYEKSTIYADGVPKLIKKSDCKVNTPSNIPTLTEFRDNADDPYSQISNEDNFLNKQITDAGVNEENELLHIDEIAAYLQEQFESIKTTSEVADDSSRVSVFSFCENYEQANESKIDKCCRLNVENKQPLLELNNNKHALELPQFDCKISSKDDISGKEINTEIASEPIENTVENSSSLTLKKDEKVIEIGEQAKSGFSNKNSVEFLVQITINNSNGIINIYNS